MSILRLFMLFNNIIIIILMNEGYGYQLLLLLWFEINKQRGEREQDMKKKLIKKKSMKKQIAYININIYNKI